MEDQKEKRTEQEKYAMGLLSPIFREINIKQDTRGYMPLVDLLCYAYAYPNVPFQEIMEILTKRNHYVGVKWIQEAETIKEREKAKYNLYPSMRRCIVTAIERTDQQTLVKYGLEELTIILGDANPEEEERIKKELLEIIGKEYEQYDAYAERVIVFFARRILEYLRTV